MKTRAVDVSAAYEMLSNCGVLDRLPFGTVYPCEEGGRHVSWLRLRAAMKIDPYESDIVVDDRSTIAQALELAGH